MLLKNILISLGAVASVAGAPTSSNDLAPRQDELYSYFWSDGIGKVDMNTDWAIRALFEWENSGSFLGGRGREIGNGNTIYIEAGFYPRGNAQLQLYGETNNPKTEYRIIEWYGTFKPFPDEPGFPKLVGNVTTDESLYHIYHQVRVSPGLGEPAIHQIYSVREKQRGIGLIDPQAHFDAYEKLGFKMEDHGMQVYGVEGYYSSGYAEMDVYLD